MYSEYYTIYLQLRNSDRELHFRYLRMSKERFDHLLSLIRDKMTKDTQLRDAITAEERLVITLRYLASGMSQQDLCYNFRVGRTTVSNIVSEVKTLTSLKPYTQLLSTNSFIFMEEKVVEVIEVPE